MKLHFEPDLDFQCQALDAVCDLFRGQGDSRTGFAVTRGPAESQGELALAEDGLGVGNPLAFSDEDLLDNLRAVQLRNDMARSKRTCPRRSDPARPAGRPAGARPPAAPSRRSREPRRRTTPATGLPHRCSR